MKIPPIALIVLLLPIAAAAQTAATATITPPPIKMGLWKTTSTHTMTGLQLPPGVAERMQASGRSLGGPQTLNTLSCITPEKWQEMFNSQQRGQNCTFSNMQQSSTSMSADFACDAAGHPTTGHMQMSFDSDTKVHGTVHMSTNMESLPQPVVIDSAIQGDYQGSDCQGIAPGSPKIIH